MKNHANTATDKVKLKFFILIVILIAPIYTNLTAQPFVPIYKNGLSTSLPIHSFESATIYQEVLSSTDSLNQGLWLTLPVLVSFSILLFSLFQFLIQIIRDRKLAEE